MTTLFSHVSIIYIVSANSITRNKLNSIEIGTLINAKKKHNNTLAVRVVFTDFKLSCRLAVATETSLLVEFRSSLSKLSSADICKRNVFVLP